MIDLLGAVVNRKSAYWLRLCWCSGFGNQNAFHQCRPDRNKGSFRILRCAQDDTQRVALIEIKGLLGSFAALRMTPNVSP